MIRFCSSIRNNLW